MIEQNLDRRRSAIESQHAHRRHVSRLDRDYFVGACAQAENGGDEVLVAGTQRGEHGLVAQLLQPRAFQTGGASGLLQGGVSLSVRDAQESGAVSVDGFGVGAVG